MAGDFTYILIRLPAIVADPAARIGALERVSKLKGRRPMTRSDSMSRRSEFDEVGALKKAIKALGESSDTMNALLEGPVETNKAAQLRGAYAKLEYAVFLLKLVTDDESPAEYDESMRKGDRLSLLRRAVDAVGSSQRNVVIDPKAALRDARTARDAVRTVLHAVNLEIRREIRRKRKK